MTLYDTCKKHSLPSKSWSEDECYQYLKFRKKLSTSHPGAGVIEYQSLLQIVIEDLLGWDINKTNPRVKVFLVY